MKFHRTMNAIYLLNLQQSIIITGVQLQSRTKYLEQSKDIAKALFPERRLGTRLCLHPIFRISWYNPNFLNFWVFNRLATREKTRIQSFFNTSNQVIFKVTVWPQFSYHLLTIPFYLWWIKTFTTIL